MISEHQFPVTKSARYFVLEPSNEPVAVLYALHGYRQLAPFFIKQFQVLADHGVRVIAPEGLHRFYINGYSGRVGASWMTKEDRATDIKDYLNYLNSLHDPLSKEWSDLPVHLLGFSQGGATACRWLASNDIPFKSLILYASVFPNDFDFDVNQSRLATINQVIAFGDDDQFATEEVIEEKMSWLKSKNVLPKLIRFVGGHEIKDAVLLDLYGVASR